MKLLGEQSAARIRPLNDARAIENGASMLSEFIIFSVAGGLIVYEGVRSTLQESQRRERVADDIATLQDEIEWLKQNLQKQQIQIDEYHLPEGINPSILKFPEREQNQDENQNQNQNENDKLINTDQQLNSTEKLLKSNVAGAVTAFENSKKSTSSSSSSSLVQNTQ